MSTAAGRKSDKVLLQRSTDVEDGGGGRETVWQTYATVYASIERVRSITGEAERVAAGGILAQPMVRIVMARTTETAALRPGDRIVAAYTGESFDVAIAQPVEGSRRELTVSCKITPLV